MNRNQNAERSKEVTMNNNKQTGVDYLVEQLFPKALSAEQYYHIEQAKEMHKEEIEIIQITNLEANYIPHFQSAKGEFFTTKFNQLTYGGNK